MLKKWLIEKCCFTDYCTVQLYKIVLKAWKQSALEHLQHPGLRQPSTWDGRVGEAAMLFISKVELAAGRRFPAEPGTSGQQVLNPWGAPWRLPALESVSPGLSAAESTKEELCFWQEHSPELCFHTGALAIPHMLFLKQAALGVTAAPAWQTLTGDPFHFKCWSLIAKEPMSKRLCPQKSCTQQPKHFTALLDPSKNHWIPQVPLSRFHLAICSQLCLKHTK